MVPTTLQRPLGPADLSGNARRLRKERFVRVVLGSMAAVSILVSVGIVVSLLVESWTFVRAISPGDLWGSQWAPPFGEYDLLTPLAGSMVVTGVAMGLAVPVGVAAAVFLSEYAGARLRRIVKPTLEVLAGVPSVVLGFFAIRWINPHIVQQISPSAPGFNLLAAGLGVGILTIPLIASVSEDALRAVPSTLREASAGLGARKVTTTVRVIVPAAVSGLVAAFILGVSRAIGETMVVFLAAGGGGNQALFTISPLEPGTTMTAAMAASVQPSDRVSEGVSLQSLFFLGLMLFVLTLLLNLIADRFVRRTRQEY